jgi:uncharacterized protein YndB with AHSA1/START domain
MRVEITRVFDAPPARVWRAWTDPGELVRWWGKRGWTAQRDTLVMDVRPGGAFRIVSINDDDGRTQVTEGVYLAVDPPHTLTWDGATVTFTDLGGGRTRMDFRTAGELGEPARGGLLSALDRLEHLLLKGTA